MGSGRGTGQRRWWGVVRRLPRATVVALRGHDLLLYAAGVTFYAALAAVPVAFVATRLAAVIAGPEHVVALGDSMARALPDAVGAPGVVRALVRQGVGLGWLPLVVAVLPASLYGEGLRRAYVTLAGADDRLTGWRGRLAVLPVLLAAPALLLALLAVTPLLADLLSEGVGGVVLGVYVALNVDWLLVSLPLAWSYRVVAPDPPSWRLALVGGFTAGAFVAGFLQGFVLFLSLPLDLGAPFGGLSAVGAVCAVLLWLWVLHLVVLVGWVATRQAGALLARPDRAARPAAQIPVVERG